MLAQQNADLLWGEPFISAHVLLALIPNTVDQALLAGSVTALQAQQSVDGSWMGDVYQTALALQALALAANPPPDPTLSNIIGGVIDAETGLALSGVTVTLTGPTADTRTTDSNGAFSFANAAAGNYSLAINYLDYAPVTATFTALAGQSLDIGSIPLTRSSTATTGIVRGVVTDADTGLPIAGVDITITGVTGSVVTDVNGAYQVANVPPSTVTLQASKTGYSIASATATITAGGVAIFSPTLSTTADVTQSLIKGTIVDGATGLSLSGVVLTISGATTASATTDALGSYSISGLNEGQTNIDASLAGYDSVIGIANVFGGSTLDFSPKLYPLGATPPNANTMGVTGVVMDSVTNAVLSGVSIQATFGGATVSLTTDVDGRFNLSGLTDLYGNLAVSLAGYTPVNMSVTLTPLSVLDLAQVRMRPAQVVKMVSDLVVTNIDMTNANNDPATLAISGSLTVDTQNIGTSNTLIPAEVVAFYDANKNLRYEENIDSLLGHSITNSVINAGATEALQVSLTGQLPFRDAPISVWIDSAQNIPESDETNNVGLSSSICRAAEPQIGGIQPVEKWHWGNEKVMTIPLVGPLIDTNGDGIIDNNDDSIVVFASHTGFVDGSPATLRAVNGKTGAEIWSVTDSTLLTDASAHPAMGDIDGDGIPEIVMYRYSGGGIVVINNDGSLKWASSATPPDPGYYNYGGITLADLDNDGLVEILARNYVLNYDGSVRWVGPVSTWHGSISYAADLDMDGTQEVIMGTFVYKADGSDYWDNSTKRDGHSVVANFDDDSFPEIVAQLGDYVTLVDNDGTTLWTTAIPSTGRGAPTVADMTGDGVPEIGIAGSTRYTVFSHDGSILWSKGTVDSSRLTGSTVFDFNGDGKAEVVYSDQNKLRIFDGATGTIIFDVAQGSATASEYPVVADIDSDGHAEILVVGDTDASTYGVRALEDVNDSWVSTRRIWNQYAYSISNVNDDATIPGQPEFSWLTHNTFRLNTFPNQNPLDQADLTASLLKLVDNGAGQPVSLSLRVGNAGAAPSVGNVAVSFYEGDPAGAGILLGSTTLSPLAAGDFTDVQIDGITTLSGTQDVFAVVDANDVVVECNELNNTVSTPVNLSTLGSLSVATDQSLYTPNSPVVLMADITNTSSLTGSYSLDLSVEDANGATVASFATQSVIDLAVGTVTQVQQSWNTGVTLAGTYQLHGILKALDGTVLSDVTNTFQIDQANVGTPAASLRTTLDRTVYNTSDTVSIQDLVTNTTVNTILEDVQLVVTVTDATAATVFTDTVVLGQMAPGAIRNVGSSYSFLAQQPGIYTVTSTLTDTVTQILLATNVVPYTVQDDLSISITGSVALQNATLNIGGQQVCTSTVTNNGIGDASALQLRQVITLPATGQEFDNFATSMDVLAGDSQSFTRTFDTTALYEGVYVCVLQHNIAGTWQALDYKPFTLVNQPPVANAGLAQSGYVTDSFTLDGTASSDPNGHTLTFSWSLIQQPVGSSAVLSSATTVAPVLTPDVRGQYVAQLIVNDGMVDSAPATILIDVLNSPPVANAGPDQIVHIGDIATLTGILSADADGDALTYQWTLANQPIGSASQLSSAAAQSPTLSIDKHGTYTLELIVNDGSVDSAVSAVTLTVENILPLAVTGVDQTAFVGDTVVLDGSASHDLDGDALSYSWTLISAPVGSTAILSDTAAVSPTIVVDKKGDFVIELTVNDGYDNSLPVTTSITVTNTPPVANAGADQLIHIGDVVTLDGSGSTDADGDALTYSWNIVSQPVGSVATLSDVAAVMPTITIDALGEYLLELVVDDGQVSSVVDQVILNAVNVAPVADAGTDQSVMVGQIVQLDGTTSSDADGDPLTYTWSIVSAPVGSVSTLSDASIAQPTFVVDVFGTYTLQLVVNDGVVDSVADTVILNVVNTPPVANAGTDQSVFVGNNVILDGSASSDADGDPLTYSWSLIQQPAGSTAVLVDTTTVNPSILIDTQGIYIAQLIVNDGIVDSTPDTVVLNVANVRPVANAGPDQTVTTPTTVTLDGSASSDADGDALTYAWSISSAPTGSAASITNPTAINPSIATDIAGNYVIQLIVNDGTIDSNPDTMTITGNDICMPNMMAYGYNGRVDLDWNPVANVDHYRIYRNNVGETSTYALMDNNHHSSMGSYSDYNVSSGTTYYYRVEAVKNNGNVCYSSTASATPSGGGMGGGGMGGGGGGHH